MKEEILESVSLAYGITYSELTAPPPKRVNQKQARGKNNTVEAKQTAAHLIWKYCSPLNPGQIAKALGYTHKQSVMAGIKKARQVMEGNRAYKERVSAIENTLLR